MQASFRNAIAGLAIASMSAGCALSPPNGDSTIASQPVGSAFVTEAKSSGSYGSGTTRSTITRAGKRTWQGKEAFVVKLPDGADLLINAQGAWIAFVKGDTPIVSYDPPLGYPFPLKVGASSISKSNMTIHATKKVVPVEVRFSVDAYEDVTTPAGTFKAFRIRSVDNGGGDNLNWYNVELATHVKQKQTRLPQHSSGPGTREIELVSIVKGK